MSENANVKYDLIFITAVEKGAACVVGLFIHLYVLFQYLFNYKKLQNTTAKPNIDMYVCMYI